MSLLPHITQPIVDPDDTPSYEMRAWMESVNSFGDNTSLAFTLVTGDVTTTGSQFLRVNGNYTITLNPSPEDGETVQIQPGGAYTVTIVGTINGATPSYITAAYDLLEIRYVSGLGEWVA